VHRGLLTYWGNQPISDRADLSTQPPSLLTSSGSEFADFETEYVAPGKGRAGSQVVVSCTDCFAAQPAIATQISAAVQMWRHMGSNETELSRAAENERKEQRE